MQVKKILPLFLVFVLFTSCNNPVSEKSINVLLLSGSNNHQWKTTTPIVKRNLEAAGVFSVTITEKPDTLSEDYLESIDVIVSDWNTWPKNDYRLPERTEKALSDFIRNGKGMVFFHSSGSVLYDWESFFEISLARWGDKTHHGRPSLARVSNFDKTHPITEGFSDFYVLDEIWEDTEIHPDAQSLAEVSTTLSQPEKLKGHSFTEPAVLINQVGKGRSCYIMFGHGDKGIKTDENGNKTGQIGAPALFNAGVKTLFQRAVEWAATGEVTLPVSDNLDKTNLKDSDLSWHQTDTSIAVLNDNSIVWQYNYNTVYSKDFFHPLRTDAGTITSLAPDDHPWHLGLWFSWKFLNGINYWEADPITHKSDGTSEIKKIYIDTGKDFSASINLELEYYKEGEPSVLYELREIQVSPPSTEGYFIDYLQNFKALEDVTLGRTPVLGEEDGKSWGGYAGLSIRFSQDIMNVEVISDQKMEDYHKSTGEWLYMGGDFIKGGTAGLSMFPHPENNSEFRRWYVTDNLIPRFQYFSPAFLFDSPMKYKKGEIFTLKNRVWISNGEVNTGILNEKYNQYINK